ncbi:peroxisomal testis-specific protein 1 [Camelus dromedarius]|nr:peroxisomal testis-specific protein 1 isoform X2 [Camelus ferus]
MKKKKHDAIVCEPKELLNPSPKVTNCYKSLWVKYSVQKAYMTQLVSSQPVSAMSRNPGHNPPSQPKENSIGQNHHQEEVIHKLAMQLRNIGDSIDHRMVQEDFQQEGRAILAHYVLVFFGGVHVLLRFLWNNHLM